MIQLLALINPSRGLFHIQCPSVAPVVVILTINVYMMCTRTDTPLLIVFIGRVIVLHQLFIVRYCLCTVLLR